jgi:hypothetical protein
MVIIYALAKSHRNDYLPSMLHLLSPSFLFELRRQLVTDVNENVSHLSIGYPTEQLDQYRLIKSFHVETMFENRHVD